MHLLQSLGLKKMRQASDLPLIWDAAACAQECVHLSLLQFQHIAHGAVEDAVVWRRVDVPLGQMANARTYAGCPMLCNMSLYLP